jgi:hypothetical protein
MRDERSEIVERKFDLNTPRCLSNRYRHAVLAEAQPLYVVTG